MAVRLVPAPQRVPPNDRPLWRLRRDNRCAVALERIYREIPNARELRVSVDNELRWSRLYRGPGLDEQAAEMRAAFEQRGWSAE